MRLLFILLISSLSIFSNLYAGTIRVDTPDSKYIEYGKKYISIIKIMTVIFIFINIISVISFKPYLLF